MISVAGFTGAGSCADREPADDAAKPSDDRDLRRRHREPGRTDWALVLPETRLGERGAAHEGAADALPLAIAEGRFVTGQSPSSSQITAQPVIDPRAAR